MEILSQLGVNQTVVVQFVIYILIFFSMAFWVFKPYALAEEQRELKTKGADQLAGEFQKKANEYNLLYAQKAKEINEKIQEIFTKEKEQALLACDSIVNQARSESQRHFEDEVQKLKINMNQVSLDMDAQVPQISALITNKLLGK